MGRVGDLADLRDHVGAVDADVGRGAKATESLIDDTDPVLQMEPNRRICQRAFIASPFTTTSRKISL